jgi:hypothetical protein
MTINNCTKLPTFHIKVQKYKYTKVKLETRTRHTPRIFHWRGRPDPKAIYHLYFILKTVIKIMS